MVTKFISAILFIVAVAVLMFSHNQNDPIFLFISNNIVVDIARIILVGGVLAVSVKGYISSNYLRTAFKVLGFGLIAFGFAAFMSINIESALYDYLKPLDFLLATELGITLSIISLSLPESVGAKEGHTHVSKPYFLYLRNRLS